MRACGGVAVNRILFLLLLCFVLVAISCESQPGLTRDQMQWKIYNRNVGTDDPNFALDVIEDGYKMIRTYKAEDHTDLGGEARLKKYVEWGWKFTIINKSGSNLSISIIYRLNDKDRFELGASYTSNELVGKGEIATIRGTSIMEYDKAKRVADSSWTISSRREDGKAMEWGVE